MINLITQFNVKVPVRMPNAAVSSPAAASHGLLLTQLTVTACLPQTVAGFVSSRFRKQKKERSRNVMENRGTSAEEDSFSPLVMERECRYVTDRSYKQYSIR